VDLHIHSPIRLHGVVLNQVSIGTILPLTYDCMLAAGASAAFIPLYTYSKLYIASVFAGCSYIFRKHLYYK
jgi:hypothetical protein